jgi:hypothetical protein
MQKKGLIRQRADFIVAKIEKDRHDVSPGIQSGESALALEV